MNAVKFSTKHSVVNVVAKVISDKKDRLRGQKNIKVSVKDFGFGIDRSELGHVFKPFYQSKKIIEGQE